MRLREIGKIKKFEDVSVPEDQTRHFGLHVASRDSDYTEYRNTLREWYMLQTHSRKRIKYRQKDIRCKVSIRMVTGVSFAVTSVYQPFSWVLTAPGVNVS